MTSSTTTAPPSQDHQDRDQERPIRISRIAGRYLVFDIADAMRLRRRHNLCGVFVGSIPQNPQQNVFMGLPMELLAEEAAVLVAAGQARVVDDAAFHPARLAALATAAAAKNARRRREERDGGDDEIEVEGGEGEGEGGDDAVLQAAGRAYLDDIKSERKLVEDEVVEQSRQARLRQVHHIKKAKGKGKDKAGKKLSRSDSVSSSLHGDAQTAATTPASAAAEGDSSLAGSDDLFDADPSGAIGATAATATTASITSEPPRQTFGVTPTTSGALLGQQQPSTTTPLSDDGDHEVDVPASSSNPLYAHLHGKGYYMMPGLRFGCDYNVYPGDPLRFHSHFQASSFGWDEEIAVLDLVAGGRLGTNVKKGFLVGGAVVPEEEVGAGDNGQPLLQEQGQEVRAFCIEWAGM
ncbi:tRNA-splicing endonuclease subunit [Diatrype stigma]|uniref:tRNA-intron lyase n=1 Tax=Diatrype stigma TaxID=117547 RepID=A0AAN9UFA7_9PEZI